MKTMLGILVVAAAFPAGAGEAGSTVPHDARWVRLPDSAQVQLITDALYGRTRQGADTPEDTRAERPCVRVSGSHAVAVFPRGGRFELEKHDGRWSVVNTLPPSGPPRRVRTEQTEAPGQSAGATFLPEPLSRELGIDRLTRQVTRTRLQRSLFSTPEKTASWYSASYSSSAPFVRAAFVQFVTDPAWNRIVYGNLNRWIRSLPVQGPSAIAVDADGRVFVGEAGANAIGVYRLSGEGDAMQLEPAWRIADVVPTDLALDDRGTPLTTADDELYVADAVHHRVVCYTLRNASATPAAAWDGFDSPSVIAVGRANGASSGILYVVDHVGRRLRAFRHEGGRLVEAASFAPGYAGYLKSLTVDHFGGVYVVDNTRNLLLKFSPELELLDSAEGIPFDGLAAVEIPFGRVEVEGEAPAWAGFDQLFALERWSPAGGAQRLRLGIRLKDVRFATDVDRSGLLTRFTLTDAADLRVRVLRDGAIVRTLSGSWVNSGRRAFFWDRKDDTGRLVGPGVYRYEITARSAYSEEATTSVTALTLPLYYHEDCGSAVANDDAHRLRGRSVRWGDLPSETASRDPERVLYRFTGLRPDVTYEVAAEFGAADGEQRLQVLTAGGVPLHEPVPAGDRPVRVDFMPVPAAAVRDGQLVVGVERLQGPDVSVTQLWLKEQGEGIGAEPVDAALPTTFSLDQNFPNPFNPSTTIRYTVPEPAHVVLKVYSVTGQEVATLVNDRREAGIHTVAFDARRQGAALASGVYFYRLTAGSFSAVRKLLLLK